MLVSAALLAVLVTKIHFENLLPKNQPPLDARLPRAGLLLTGFGIVLSAWRWQRVLARLRRRRAAAHAHDALLRRAVRRERAAVDDRRRRAAGEPGRRQHRVQRDVSFAAVVLERLSGFVALPLLVLPRLRDQPVAARGRPRLGRARRSPAARSLLLGVILVLAGHPKPGGPVREHENWMRFIGAVHIGVDRLRAPPARGARRPRRGARLPGVGGRLGRTARSTSLDARVPTARSSRSCPRSRWRRWCRSRSAGSASARACSSSSSPARRLDGRRGRDRAALVRHDARS